MAAATITRGPFLHMHVGRVEQAEPAGTICLGYYRRYQKLNCTPDGVQVLEDISGPRIPWDSLYVPLEVVKCEIFYRHELRARLSSVGVNPHYLYYISESITWLALSLAADLPSSSGFCIMVDLEFLEVEEDDELFYAFVPPEEENVDVPPETGTSKRAIEKLINKGGFLADTSDQVLDKCSICLEDLSSPDGAELLRMDCSHLYHQSCVVSWLERRNTCPMCRREVEQE